MNFVEFELCTSRKSSGACSAAQTLVSTQPGASEGALPAWRTARCGVPYRSAPQRFASAQHIETAGAYGDEQGRTTVDSEQLEVGSA